MRALKVLAAVALMMIMLPAAPAQAGGWAVTYLDPLPSTFEAGRGYTVGFWVLQHGTHPYESELGEVGLTLVDPEGKRSVFPAVRLPEAAHYAAAIVAARPGRWRVVARQGLFEDYVVGTLTVPGQLALAPVPTPMSVDDGHAHGWGAIRPPIAAEHDAAAPAGAAHVDGVHRSSAPVAVAAEASAAAPGPGAWTVALAITALGLVILLVIRRPLAVAVRKIWRRRARRDALRPVIDR